LTSLLDNPGYAVPVAPAHVSSDSSTNVALRHVTLAVRSMAPVTALCLLLVGCAQYYWVRPNTPEVAFYRDSAECARSASPPLTGQQEKVRMSHDLYKACLLERGYRRDKRWMEPKDGWRGLSDD
jgi:hypothetical protein